MPDGHAPEPAKLSRDECQAKIEWLEKVVPSFEKQIFDRLNDTERALMLEIHNVGAQLIVSNDYILASGGGGK